MIFYQEHNSVGNYNYNIYTYTNCGYAMHFHKNLEFLYVMEGKISVEINGISGKMSEGEFAVVLPNQLHSFDVPADSKAWVGVFSEDFIKEFVKITTKKEGVNLSFRCNAAELDYLKASLLSGGEKDTLSLKASLYTICQRYIKEIPLRLAQGKSCDAAHRIIEYIEIHFRENISLKDLANELGYEYHYLSRLFKNTFKTSFRTFLNQYRFEYAKELILSTDKTFAEVAFECGFGSTRSFNRIYYSFAGTPPKALREKAMGFSPN